MAATRGYWRDTGERADLGPMVVTSGLGPADLLFTRTAAGRRVVLQARSAAFSAAFVPPGERLDRWQ